MNININSNSLKSGNLSIQLSEAQENQIIKNDLVNKPIQLSDIKSILDLDAIQSKKLRSAYRNDIKAKISGSLKITSISDMEKNLTEISTFGKLKNLRLFGFKVNGDKRDSTYLMFTEVEQKESKKK